MNINFYIHLSRWFHITFYNKTDVLLFYYRSILIYVCIQSLYGFILLNLYSINFWWPVIEIKMIKVFFSAHEFCEWLLLRFNPFYSRENSNFRLCMVWFIYCICTYIYTLYMYITYVWSKYTHCPFFIMLVNKYCLPAIEILFLHITHFHAALENSHTLSNLVKPK